MGAAATPMLRMRKQAQPGSDAGPRLGVCALTHSARRSRLRVAALGPVAGAHLACLSCSSVMSGSFLPRSLCTCRIPCPECCHPRAVRGCIQLSPPQRGHPWKTENNDIPASLIVILSAHLSAAPPCDARSLSRGASPRSSILWARLVPAPSFSLSPRSFCGAPRRGSWGSDVLGWTVRGSCSL